MLAEIFNKCSRFVWVNRCFLLLMIKIKIQWHTLSDKDSDQYKLKRAHCVHPLIIHSLYVHTHSLFLSYIHSHKCTSQTDAQALSFTSQCFFFTMHIQCQHLPQNGIFFSSLFFRPHIFSTTGPSIWNNLLSSVWHAQTLSSFKSHSRLTFFLLLLTLPTVSSLPQVNLCVCVCVCMCARKSHVCASIWDWGVGMKSDDKSVYINIVLMLVVLA